MGAAGDEPTHPACPAPDEPSAIPPRIARFEVLGKLGEGGMGYVYHALDPSLGRPVALKVVHPERASAGGRERLLREAQALAQVTHPNVVTVYEVGVYGGGVFVAMELISGQTLSSWLESEPRAPRDVLEKLVQAGHGLQAAHDAGLLHRDFKADNLVIGDDGRARVVDFGLARAMRVVEPEALSTTGGTLPQRDERSKNAQLVAPLTIAGSILGTPSYMAPEQFDGIVSAASDQWSFCVTLYRALYGRPPFRGDDLASLRKAITTTELKMPAAGIVPAIVGEVILRGLSKEPSERWSSMGELVDALDSAFSSDAPKDKVTFLWQRRLGAAGLILVALANEIGSGLHSNFTFRVDVETVLVQGLVGLGAGLALLFFLRNGVKRSTYVRRTMTFAIVAVAVPVAHRSLALLANEHDVPLILRIDALSICGLSIFSGVAVDRYHHYVGGLMAAYVVLSLAVPSIAVPGFGVAMGGCVALGLWFWRDGALRSPSTLSLGSRSRSRSRSPSAKAASSPPPPPSPPANPAVDVPTERLPTESD